MGYVISAVAALHSLLSGARGQAPKDLWPLEWFVACVDGCISTRCLVTLTILFAQTSYQ